MEPSAPVSSERRKHRHMGRGGGGGRFYFHVKIPVVNVPHFPEEKGLDVMESHSLHKMCIGHYQAS